MKIFELTFDVYNFWYTSDKYGYSTVKKYFTTEEKAKNYVVNYNRNPWVYGHNGIVCIAPTSNVFIPIKDNQIKEIEVDNKTFISLITNS